eukprot:6416704-Prymnesium_polylepis.2
MCIRDRPGPSRIRAVPVSRWPVHGGPQSGGGLPSGRPPRLPTLHNYQRQVFCFSIGYSKIGPVRSGLTVTRNERSVSLKRRHCTAFYTIVDTPGDPPVTSHVTSQHTTHNFRLSTLSVRWSLVSRVSRKQKHASSDRSVLLGYGFVSSRPAVCGVDCGFAFADT